jgi:hypothetical protein
MGPARRGEAHWTGKKMGWTYAIKNGRSTAEFLERELKPWTIHACAASGRVYYLATESPDRPGNVFATVVLTAGGPKNFGYKIIDEEMGPVDDHCPQKILDLLSPTENECAMDWRKRCQKWNKESKEVKNIAEDSVIRTSEPLWFPAIKREFSLFRCVNAKKGHYVAIGDDGRGLVRIPPKHLVGRFEIVPEGNDYGSCVAREDQASD